MFGGWRVLGACICDVFVRGVFCLFGVFFLGNVILGFVLVVVFCVWCLLEWWFLRLVLVVRVVLLGGFFFGVVLVG